MLTVNHEVSIGEKEFQVHEYHPDQAYHEIGDVPFFVRLHPWYRGGAGKVFVEVGFEDDDYEGEPSWCVIVDRAEFVEGILATFPELTRADGSA